MKDGMIVVDADRHVIEPSDLWQRYMPADVRDKAPGWDFSGPRGGNFQFAGVPIPEPTWIADRTGLFEADRFAEAAARDYDVPSHLSAMDAEGIDLAVLFPSRGLLVPGVVDVDPALIMLAAKAYNDWLADFCRDGSERLFGVGMLDLRDTEAARAEAVRCVEELGFVGLFLRPNVVEGKPLFDPKYEPLGRRSPSWTCPCASTKGPKCGFLRSGRWSSATGGPSGTSARTRMRSRSPWSPSSWAAYSSGTHRCAVHSSSAAQVGCPTGCGGWTSTLNRGCGGTRAWERSPTSASPRRSMCGGSALSRSRATRSRAGTPSRH